MNQSNIIITEIQLNEKIKFQISECLIYESFDEKLKFSKEDGQPFKLTFTIDLGIPSLITSLKFITQNSEKCQKLFKLIDIEGSTFSESNEYVRLLKVNDNIKHFETSITNSISVYNNKEVSKNFFQICCYGVTKSIRLSFLYVREDSRMKSEKSLGDAVVLTDTPEEDRKQINLEEEAVNCFLSNMEMVRVLGFSLLHNPAASQVVTLMNISNLFTKNNKFDEAIEADIILGYALTSSRKYLQASEIFRRSSNYFIKKFEAIKQTDFSSIFQNDANLNASGHNNNQGGGGGNGGCGGGVGGGNYTYSPQFKLLGSFSSIIPQEQLQFSHSGLFNSSGMHSMGTTNKKLLRAAKLELLVADSIRSPSKYNQKLQAYQQATEYFLGHRLVIGAPGITYQNCDTYTSLLKLCPYLCKFLIKTLDEKIDPLKIAAIRGIEYLIEHLGCTLANQLPQILKQVILTYPNIQQIQQCNNNTDTATVQETISSGFDEKMVRETSRNGQIMLKQLVQAHQRMIIDIYHRLLESYINLLASASSQILKNIFSDVIVAQLFSQEICNEIKIFLFRIAEKIISICQGDLFITSNFIINLISTLLTQQQGGQNLSGIYINKGPEDLIQIKGGNANNNGSTLMRQSALRMWDAIKSKLIVNMEIHHINKIIEMVNESILNFTENIGQQQGPEADFNFSNGVGVGGGAGSNGVGGIIDFQLDLIGIICQREKRVLQTLTPNLAKYSRKLEQSREGLNLKSLIRPLQILIDFTLNQSRNLEFFKKIWIILLELLNTIQSKNQDHSFNEILIPILTKVQNYIKNQSPKLPMLNFLIIIFNSFDISQCDQQLKKFIYSFLVTFLDCIPHSIFDETFQLFDLLIGKVEEMQEDLINKILTSFIDQYTMRGNSYQRSLSTFLNLIMNSQQIQQNTSENQEQLLQDQQQPKNYFLQLLNICLLQNIEPVTDDLSALQLVNNQEQSQTATYYNSACKSKVTNCTSSLMLAAHKQLDSKSIVKMNDAFLDKLNLLHDAMQNLKEFHFPILISLIKESQLQESILRLLSSGNSKIRLKAFSIAKKIYEKFSQLPENNTLMQPTVASEQQQQINNALEQQNQIVSHSNIPETQNNPNSKTSKLEEKKTSPQQIQQQQPQKILAGGGSESIIVNNSKQQLQQQQPQPSFTYSKIMISKFILVVLRVALENFNDPKQQFNALFLMDQHFQTIFGGPSLEEEVAFYQKSIKQVKRQGSQTINQDQQTYQQQQKQKKIQILDIETCDFNQNQVFSYSDETYLHMRLLQILKLWPLIQTIIMSPWSNIRSLAYGVICNWVRPDLNHYKSSYQKKLSQIINSLLMSLLVSKESECRTGGLNILGSLCGLNYNFDIKVNELRNLLGFFRRHEHLISLAIWEAVYEIQSDWDITNQAAAMTIIQVSAPRDSIRHFFRLKKEGMTLKANHIQPGASAVNLSNILNQQQHHHFQHQYSSTLKNEDSLFVNDNILRSGKQEMTPNQQQQQQSLFLQTDEYTGLKLQMNNNNNNNNASIDSCSFEQEHQNILLGSAFCGGAGEDSVNSDKNSINNEEMEGENDFFWVDFTSDEEIRDMISMFRNEQKPPLTLWIERNHYNTENREDENAQSGTQTGNNEEDEMFLNEYGHNNFQQGQFVGEVGFRERPYSKYKRIIKDIDAIGPSCKGGAENQLHLQRDEDLDIEHLGIIELEDDEFADYYDVQLNELKKTKDLNKNFGNDMSDNVRMQIGSQGIKLKQEEFNKEMMYNIKQYDIDFLNQEGQQQQFQQPPDNLIEIQHYNQMMGDNSMSLNEKQNFDKRMRKDQINQFKLDYREFQQLQQNQMEANQIIQDDSDDRPGSRVGFYYKNNSQSVNVQKNDDDLIIYDQMQEIEEELNAPQIPSKNQHQMSHQQQQDQDNKNKQPQRQYDAELADINQELIATIEDPKAQIYQQADQFQKIKDKQNIINRTQKQNELQEIIKGSQQVQKQLQAKIINISSDKNDQSQQLLQNQEKKDTNNKEDIGQQQTQLNLMNQDLIKVYDEKDLHQLQQQQQQEDKKTQQLPQPQQQLQPIINQAQVANGQEQLQQQNRQIQQKGTLDNNIDRVTISFSNSCLFNDDQQENIISINNQKQQPQQTIQQQLVIVNNKNNYGVEYQIQQRDDQGDIEQLIFYDKDPNQQIMVNQLLNDKNVGSKQQQQQLKKKVNPFEANTDQQIISNQQAIQNKITPEKSKTPVHNTTPYKVQNNRYQSVEQKRTPHQVNNQPIQFTNKILDNLMDLNNFDLLERPVAGTSKNKKNAQLFGNNNNNEEESHNIRQPSPFQKKKDKNQQNKQNKGACQIGNFFQSNSVCNKTPTHSPMVKNNQKDKRFEKKKQAIEYDQLFENTTPNPMMEMDINNKNYQNLNYNMFNLQQQQQQQQNKRPPNPGKGKFKNLNINFDKLNQTDLLSKFLDSTKSTNSTKKASHITPQSCKTKHSFEQQQQLQQSLKQQRKSKSKESKNISNNDQMQQQFYNLHEQAFEIMENNYNSQNQTLNLSELNDEFNQSKRSSIGPYPIDHLLEQITSTKNQANKKNKKQSFSNKKKQQLQYSPDEYSNNSGKNNNNKQLIMQIQTLGGTMKQKQQNLDVYKNPKSSKNKNKSHSISPNRNQHSVDEKNANFLRRQNPSFFLQQKQQQFFNNKQGNNRLQNQTLNLYNKKFLSNNKNTSDNGSNLNNKTL